MASLPETMLAFRLDHTSGAKHPTKATVPVPKKIGPDEVLIKVEAAGLCHSDLVSEQMSIQVSFGFTDRIYLD